MNCSILVTADWHAGAGTGLSADRLADQAAVYKQIAHLAFDRQVDVVAFCGDATHRPRPTPAEMMAVRDAFSLIGAYEIPIVAISGNAHDVTSAGATIALELMDPKHGWFRLARTPQVVYPFANPELPCFACLPWTSVANLAAASSDDRDVVIEDATRLLVEAAAGLKAEAGDTPCVLLTHFSLSGGHSSTGMDALLFREIVLPTHDLMALGFRAILAGHLHAPQIIEHQPLVLYPGSPCVVDFGEAGHDHGCMIVTLDDDGTATSEFVPLEDRPFVTIEASFDHQALELEWATTGLDGAVVRFRYTATPDQARLVDHDEIRAKLLSFGAHRVHAIQATIIAADRARSSAVTDETGPAEAVDAYIASRELDDATGGQLRDRSAAYLERAR